MAAFGGLILTNKGRNVLAKAQSGKQLKITKVVIGDGKLGSSESIVGLSNLKNQVLSFSIKEIKILQNAIATIVFKFDNSEVTEGFYWREIGVIAEDPDTKEEILYCYGNAGENGDYIAAGGDADLLEKYVSIGVSVENVSNVSAIIDNSLVFISQEEFEQYKEEKIFKWDGKDSTENPDNIALFQEIVDYSRENGVAYVIGSIEPTYQKQYPGVYAIKNVLGNKENKYYGVLDIFNVQYTTGSSRAVFMRRGIGIVTDENGNVTQVKDIGGDTIKLDYIDTNIDYLDEANESTYYEPKYPGSPAPKKYVDNAKEEALEEGIIVSATEPQDENRRKIWVQKAKNLFNPVKYDRTNASTVSYSNNVLTVSSTATNTTPYAIWKYDLKQGESLTISAKINESHGRIVARIAGSSSTLKFMEYAENKQSWTYTATENTSIEVLIYSSKTTPTGAISATYSEVMVEKNTSASTYEPYVEDAIYVKNSAGEYEQILKYANRLEALENKTKIEELNVASLLKNGWAIHNDTGCQIFKKDNIVTVQLCIRDGTAKNILFLPEGWRPSKLMYFPCSSNKTNISSYVSISSAGQLSSTDSLFGSGYLLFINFSYKVG